MQEEFQQESEVEFSSLDEMQQLEKDDAKKQVPESQASKDPLANKSREDLLKMYQDSQDFIKRQSDEVAFSRKMIADSLSRQPQQAPKNEPANEEIPDSEFLINPKQALERAINNHPAIKRAEKQNQENQVSNQKNEFLQLVPDAMDIVKSDEFRQYMDSNPIKQRLLRQADATGNVELAADILLTFKQTRVEKAEVTKQVAKDGRDDDLKAMKVNSGRGRVENKPIYRRRDIVDLMRTNPKKYESMYEEIMQAYAEDRVK